MAARGVKPWLLTVYVPGRDGEPIAIRTRWKEPKEAFKQAIAMMADNNATSQELEYDPLEASS